MCWSGASETWMATSCARAPTMKSSASTMRVGCSLLVLTREDALSPSLTVRIGGLYLGGRFRVAEEVTRAEDVDARWHASMLKACWVSDPARTCR
jgi:hypothetical protein